MASSSTSSTVKIIESTRIKPSPHSHKSFLLQLTFFDTFWFKVPPVKRLFFYKLNELTLTRFNSEILPKLKQSLSLTLHHYLPITGNLIWPSNSPKPIISYTPNDAASLTVAESNSDFNLLSSNNEVYEAVQLHPLIPQLISSDDSASIIAIQITLFRDQGFSIGITAHHTVLDGKTTTMFIKSWAYICNRVNSGNSTLPTELTPVFDREIIKDPTGLELDTLYLNQWLNYTTKSLKISTDHKGAAPNLVRATVTINPEDFKKMRERVLSKSSKELHLSSFVITLAYVTTCIVKARGISGGEGDEIDRTIAIGFTADCRSRLDPQIPENYFGNCNTVLGGLAQASDFIDLENGFVFAVEKISDIVKGLIEKGVFDGAEDRLKFDSGKHHGPIQAITVAGSPRFNLYETHFGWGRLEKVVVVSIDKNEAISMAESRVEKKGIEVGLALKKHEMDRFLHVSQRCLTK